MDNAKETVEGYVKDLVSWYGNTVFQNLTESEKGTLTALILLDDTNHGINAISANALDIAVMVGEHMANLGKNKDTNYPLEIVRKIFSASVDYMENYINKLLKDEYDKYNTDEAVNDAVVEDEIQEILYRRAFEN